MSVTFESLPSFSITNLLQILRRGGYNLSSLEKTLSPGKYLQADLTWTRSYFHSKEDVFSGKVYLRRDEVDGLFLDFRYQYGGEERKTLFYLRSKESNLLPGEVRYYFLDPFAQTEPGLCGKIYFFKGYFYSGDYLRRNYGVLYRQQTRGHTDRYVWSIYERIPEREKMKFKKTHYRGKETPVYRRYNHLVNEGERRVNSHIAQYLWKTYGENYFPDLYDRRV